MKEFKYVVTDPEGIHARPAGILVKQAAGYTHPLKLQKVIKQQMQRESSE